MTEFRDLSAVPDDPLTHGEPSPGRHRSSATTESPDLEPRLVRSAVNGRVYVVTNYGQRGDEEIVPYEKYDVSDDFEQLLDDPHVPFGPALYAVASRLYDIARDETPDEARAARIAAIASSLAYTFRGQPAD